jgi:hypothetical protein
MSRASTIAGLLSQPDSPNRVICAGEGCDATTLAPKLGVPADWEALFRTGFGWVLICPRCLDSVEAEYRGGGGTRKPSGAGGFRHEA